jgi:2'-deoxynucleoside 5'-phosphate N-hydrolase
VKIFLSIKHYADNRNKQLIEDISSLLTSKGFETINICRDIEKWGKLDLSPQKLMFETFRALDRCDIVLIELSVKGVGLGIEAGYAFARNKPIITIANREANISKSLEGISTAKFTFGSLDDLDQFFNGLGNINKTKVAFFDKQNKS